MKVAGFRVEPISMVDWEGFQRIRVWTRTDGAGMFGYGSGRGSERL